MTLPRPALLALLGLALIGAALIGTRSMRAAPDAPAPAKPAAKPATPATEKPAAKAAKSRADAAKQKADAAIADPLGTLPRRLARAIRNRKLVVLMLAQPGGADDAEVRRAAKALAPAGTEIFVDDVDQVRRYAAIAGSIGLSQAPATVVVTPDRRARLVEGYVDPKTLRQLLVDSTR